MTKLVCYCCGKEIKSGSFSLVHMQETQADRVFIFLNAHAKRVEKPKTVIRVLAT